MIAITFNLKDRVKNDTFRSVNFIYKNGVGTPIDLTGASIHIQFRFRCKTGTIVKDVTDGNGITITDPLNGMFTLDEFTPVDWEVDTYYYDVEVTFLDGTIKTYVNGTVKVLQDTTKV